jgi:hypothetical protein
MTTKPGTWAFHLLPLATGHFLDHIWTMETLSLSQAKQRLGKVADAVLRGKPVLIIRKSKLLILQAYEMPEPVPLRPPGFFHDLYTADEIAEVNFLASRAPVGTRP